MMNCMDGWMDGWMRTYQEILGWWECSIHVHHVVRQVSLILPLDMDTFAEEYELIA